MNILVDINHPAHVHLFKNLIRHARKAGHLVTITIRDKDVTKHLLDYYSLPYITLSKESKGLVSRFKELIVRDFRILQLHKKIKFDLALGTSVSIAHLSIFAKVPSHNFNEDDDYIDPLFEILAYPFSTKIIVPDCMPTLRYVQKKVAYPSYHELAYLHPEEFTADPAIVESYGLKPYEYVLVRKSALQATHDLRAKGISGNVWTRLQEIFQGFTVIVSHELDKKYQVKPWDMHHILACAKLVVSDSQTMTAEAAVLGTPSVRYNTFVGRICYLNELESKYGLTYGFLPDRDEEKMYEKIKYILNNPVRSKWDEKRKKLLADKVNMNIWMLNYLNLL